MPGSKDGGCAERDSPAGARSDGVSYRGGPGRNTHWKNAKRMYLGHPNPLTEAIFRILNDQIPQAINRDPGSTLHLHFMIFRQSELED